LEENAPPGDHAPPVGGRLELSVAVRRLVRVLVVVIVALSALSFVGQVVVEFVIAENKYLDRIAEWVDVNREGSLPTWYATMTLMACAVMLGVIAVDAARRRRPYPFHWAALVVIFALLSLEEILGVHSEATRVLRSVVSITDGPGYALALGAIALIGIVVVVLIFGRFYLHLPSRWRWWFTIAAVIYLTGVFASDAIGDYLIAANGEHTLAYIVVLTLEELLEMTGVLIFLVMLLEYIRSFVGRVSLDVIDPSGLAGTG
jgi:hypothetical protein